MTYETDIPDETEMPDESTTLTEFLIKNTGRAYDDLLEKLNGDAGAGLAEDAKEALRSNDLLRITHVLEREACKPGTDQPPPSMNVIIRFPPR